MKIKQVHLFSFKDCRLLLPEDILDVYGIQMLLSSGKLSEDQETEVKARLYQIQLYYINSAKSRIIAEAKFCGVDVNNMSIKELINNIKSNIKITEGEPLMRSILRAHQIAGSDISDIPFKFGLKTEEKKASSVNPNWFSENAKWVQISKAYIDVEKAETPNEIIQAVDVLNNLQHNSFHVLIDLQSGRMLGTETKESDDKAKTILKKVLDIKCHKKDPKEYSNKMSKEIRTLVLKLL